MNARWLKYLPNFIRVRLDGRHGLQAVLGNSGWLVADRILRMGVGLFVGIWIARYLGPQQFGLWNYAIAFSTLFGAFATLGLENIVVRELVRTPERQNEILGSAFALKLIGGTAALLVNLLAISLVRGGETLTLWLVGITAAGQIFQSLNVIVFYFQAKVQSKYTVYAANGAFLLTTVAKIVMLLSGAPLVAFAWAGLAEMILTACFLIIAYSKNHHRMRAWRYEGRVARELLGHSWPLLLSGMAVMIYMRIDQIMIGEMLGDRHVGLFSAAVKISEVWYFVPMAMASSVFPTIVESKKLGDPIYYARLQRFITLMTWAAISMAVVVTFARDLILGLLYGAAYAASATVLAVHIWAGVFVAMGVASSGWFIVENLQKFSFYRTLSGAIANVMLNVFLIPRYGIDGAAAATVASFGLGSFLFDAFNRKTRPIFWMKVRAFNPLSALAAKEKGR